jgi:hypothetical protein
VTSPLELAEYFAPREASLAVLDAFGREPLPADPCAEREPCRSNRAPAPLYLAPPVYFDPRGPPLAALDAPGEVELAAGPPVQLQGEPAPAAKELLLAPELVVDLVCRGRRQFWDPSVSQQQADSPSMARCSAALKAVCPCAPADSDWKMYSRPD